MIQSGTNYLVSYCGNNNAKNRALTCYDKESSTDDIDNRFSLDRNRCLEQALGSFYRRRFFSWLVRWSNSSVDSGKVFALIGGAFGFEESVVIGAILLDTSLVLRLYSM